jgi:hypothetical protein
MLGKNDRHKSLASEDLLPLHGAKTGDELKAEGNLTNSFHHLNAFGLLFSGVELVDHLQKRLDVHFSFHRFSGV